MNYSNTDSFVLHSIPAAVVQDRNQFPETYQLLSSALGNSFRARGINDLGMIEFWITKEGADSSDPCSHSVWIEQENLTALTRVSPD